MTGHTHTPELRHHRLYDITVIREGAWVCAECEAFLGYHDPRISAGDARLAAAVLAYSEGGAC